MKITYRGDNPNELIRKFIPIIDYIETWYKQVVRKTLKIHYFYLNINLKDRNYKFSSISEFQDYYPKIDLSKIEVISSEISFCSIGKSASRAITLDIEGYVSENESYFILGIESEKIGLIDSLFTDIFNNVLVDSTQYQYDEYEEVERDRLDKANSCVNILKKVPSLQLRLKQGIASEKELQRFLWPILKSHFDDLQDEFTLPRFGTMEYKPDFGIPSAMLLIETKYINKNQDIKRVQKEIHDDVVGYLNKQDQYKEIIVLIYNKNNIQIGDGLKKDLEMLASIKEVIITPGIGIK